MINYDAYWLQRKQHKASELQETDKLQKVTNPTIKRKPKSSLKEKTHD